MGTVRAGRKNLLGQAVLGNSASARTKRMAWVFAGYIPLRRGILEHVQKGFLNKTDFSIYCLLLLLADHHTGVWWGSGKALGLYNFPRSTAQKSLQRLESKGYIKRFPIPGVHSNYPILINKYAITDGQHKGLLLDAKQTTSPNCLSFVKQHVGEHLVEHVGEHVGPIQEGRTEKKEKRKNTAQASPSLYGFEAFWKAYPKKIAREHIEKKWKRITANNRSLILQGLKKWLLYWEIAKTEKKFIPYPATFLNQRRWEDEPPTAEHRTESAIDRGPQLLSEKKIGKCSKCGKDTVPGLAMCYECLTPHWKKKAPVNP